LGLGLGLGLGDPWVTQGSPKRHASVDLWKRLCLQQKDAKCRVGRKEIAKIAEIAKLAIETTL
jgi:hypothetical protein